MKVIAANKRAEYDFNITQKIEAGIVLYGSEVKSLRINTGSIRGSYILEKGSNLWLLNCYIKKYNNSNINYDPNRERMLLVSKKEFNKIVGLVKQGGMTLVPITMYFNDKGLAKLNFGIGKGKKKYDKRETIKEKDWNIKKERFLKNS
tara:strand:+ start:114 stop:557 length:444 start_codon:yes stop_codon:yes gene_type:complete